MNGFILKLMLYICFIEFSFENIENIKKVDSDYQKEEPFFTFVSRNTTDSDKMKSDDEDSKRLNIFDRYPSLDFPYHLYLYRPHSLHISVSKLRHKKIIVKFNYTTQDSYNKYFFHLR
jgi:hypothetical protein